MARGRVFRKAFGICDVAKSRGIDVNVFEGSRRVALLLKVLWVLGALAIIWHNSPFVSMAFATSSPDAAFSKVDGCASGTDARVFISRPIGNGKSVSLELCFKPLRADSGAQLVPYKMQKGWWWGNLRYSPEVEAYTKARAESFQLSQADQRAAREEWNRQWWSNSRSTGLFAVGGWVVLSLLQMLVGWIVRGFFGIPWDQDRRPGCPGRRYPA